MDALYKTRIFEPCLELIRKDAILRNKTENIEDYMESQKKKLLDEFDEGKIIIPRIVITTGSRCTLQCKDCVQLMPHYKEPFDIDIKELLNDVRNFFGKIDKCISVSIVGGEPFIYPWLDKLLMELIGNDKLLYIELVTNGTRIPEEQVLELCANEKVAVNISDYGDVVLLSKFVTKLDEYGILSYCISDEKWIDVGSHLARGRDDKELSAMYLSCGSGKMCKTLMKGKLFDCARAAYLYDLNYGPDIPYVDFNNEQLEPKDIIDYFLKKNSKACDYCDFNALEKKYIIPAQQVNGKYLRKSRYTMIARKDYEAIVEAKEWWQTQYNNVVKQNAELKDWVEQLEEAKEYFLGQIANLEKENQNLRGKNE